MLSWSIYHHSGQRLGANTRSEGWPRFLPSHSPSLCFLRLLPSSVLSPLDHANSFPLFVISSRWVFTLDRKLPFRIMDVESHCVCGDTTRGGCWHLSFNWVARLTRNMRNRKRGIMVSLTISRIAVDFVTGWTIFFPHVFFPFSLFSSSGFFLRLLPPSRMSRVIAGIGGDARRSTGIIS